MDVLRWSRYEIENYLLHPDAIVRALDFERGIESVERTLPT